MRRKLRTKLIAGALVILAILLGIVLDFVYSPLSLPRTPLEFSLEPGSSLKSAAAQMQRVGVLDERTSFVLFARILGKTRQIKFGNYQLEKPISRLELLDMISSGRSEQSQLTVVEGSSFRDFRAALNAHPKLRHDSALLSEQELLQRIGATEAVAEGLFFPDTYNFASGSSDLRVLQRAYHLMQQRLSHVWEEREAGLPVTSPYQVLILASIVEKETGQGTDRPMIAAVFSNRLRIGMRLQTDPTVIYGLGESFDGNLRRRDLTADTPYNTYTRKGLPPTPISLPGLASLQAVVHPAQTRALYFVAKGDGSSHFSNTLSEHNRAVKQYQLK